MIIYVEDRKESIKKIPEFMSLAKSICKYQAYFDKLATTGN